MGDLAALWDLCWERLGARDRPQSLRWPVLATVGRDGGAEARMVVLRGADPAARRFEFHTDRLAAKVAEGARDPRATLLFWDPDTSLQIRARVDLTILTGEAARGRWDAVGPAERDSYGTEPPPGAAIPDPDAHAAAPSPDRFAVIAAQLVSLDLLHLRPAGHRRALYRADEDFSGRWLAP